MNGKVLIVDDDRITLRQVRFEAERLDFETVTVETAEQALRSVKGEEPDVIILDLVLPDLSGQEVLKRFKKMGIRAPVIVLTGQSESAHAKECMELGAHDFVPKPFDSARLVTSLRNAFQFGRVARELRRLRGFDRIHGESPAILQTIGLLRRAADSDVTVLLEGESGTGKEVAAWAIHAESRRCGRGEFVAVNCGAIPETLIEAELFGHEKGAFTGASGARAGRFEAAHDGTIFLDEIGELRPDLQVKLLRVLQERTVDRIGGGKTRHIDVRVIAATNRDLKAEVDAGRFRDDLYYRLAVFPACLPPLRDREGDVLLLADEFMRRFAERHRRTLKGLSDDAKKMLVAYRWKGNVRELENVVERAVILADTDMIVPRHLPDDIAHRKSGGNGKAAVAADAQEANGSHQAQTGVIHTLEQEEQRIIRRALELTGWNLQETAQRLGIGRATIYRKLERYGIRRR